MPSDDVELSAMVLLAALVGHKPIRVTRRYDMVEVAVAVTTDELRELGRKIGGNADADE